MVATVTTGIVLGSSQMSCCVQIRTSAAVGTAFVFGSGLNSYFLTAGHNLQAVAESENVLFKRGNDWQSFEIDKIFRHPDGDDVAAFTLIGIQWKVGDDLLPKFGLSPGGEVKFLGFPHGLESNYPSETGFSSPFVRTAFLSGIYLHEGRELMMLDGFNNPGYSGGPIYARADNGTPSLAGIISGYRIEEKSKSIVYELSSDGMEKRSDSLFVKINSGMIHAVAIGRIEPLLSIISEFNGSRSKRSSR